MSDRDLSTKLDFDRLAGTYGRDDELSAIRAAYLRVSGRCRSSSPADQLQDGDDPSRRSSPSEAVLVSGPPGVGKSHLVEHALVTCGRDDDDFRSVQASFRTDAPRWMGGEECGCDFGGGGGGDRSGGVVRPVLQQRRQPHFFAKGDFDESGCGGPYSGIASAMRRLCEQFRIAIEDDPALGDGLRSAVEERMGLDCEAVAALVPEARYLLAATQEEAGGSDGAAERGGEAVAEDDREDGRELASKEEPVRISPETQSKFNFAFRAFMQALCSQSDIIVIYLDGLQWADVSSVDLIKTLLSDPELMNMLLIGSLRDDDAGLGHLKLMQEVDAMKLTHIPITNLDLESTNLLVSDLLRIDTDTTAPLAEIVHQRTDGNAFYLRQFLRAMQEEGLLNFSFRTLSWMWADADKIRSTMALSENVVDVLLIRLKKLSLVVQCALGLASFLGSQFSLDLLEAVVAAMQETSSKTRPNNSGADMTTAVSPLEKTEGSPPLRLALCSALEVAMSNGILETAKVGGGTKMYRFTDDQLKHTASSLFPVGPQREVLHACIGETLWAQLVASGTMGNYDLLFTTVNHMNRALHSVEKESKRVPLAGINFRAGQIAAESSAFIPAAEYFTIGMKLLGFDGAWDRHYDLCLDTFIASAKTDCCLGRYDESYRTVNLVSTMARSPVDKAHVLLVNIDLFRTRGNLEASIEEGMKILSLLGIKFPRTALPHTVAMDLLKTRWMTRNLTSEDVASLPIMWDRTKLVAMEVMAKMIKSAILLASGLMPLIICRMVRMTIKHGISRSCSPGAFAAYALITCGGLCDIEKGYEYGRMALSMQKDVGGEESLCSVVVTFHATVAFWRDQMQLCLDPLLEAYKLGMRCGDTAGAMMAAMNYCAYYFYNGLPLAPLEKDLSRYHLLIVAYKTQLHLDIVLPIWQFVRKLMGCCDYPSVLSGDVFNEKEMNSFTMATKGAVVSCTVWGWQMELSFLFDDMEAVQIYATKTRPFRKHVLHYAGPRHLFIDALSCFSISRKMKKRNWQTRARKIMKKIQRWVSRGAGNFLHMLLLLNAEDAALSTDVSSLKRKYDDAISVAARLGYKGDEAIANERAGESLLMKKDEYWASYYLSRSCMIYGEWGARAKAAHIKEKYAALFESEHTDVSSSPAAVKNSLRGRERYTDEATQHSQISLKQL